MDQTKKKLALLGNGYLSGIVVEAYNMGLLEGYKLLPASWDGQRRKQRRWLQRQAAEPAAPLKS